MQPTSGDVRRAPIIILVGAGLLATALVMSRPTSERQTRPERAWTVDVLTVQRGTLRPTLDLFGRVESPQAAEMTAAVTADVKSVAVREGDLAEPDALLIELDARDAELELIEREADVKDLRAQLEQTRRRIASNRSALTKQEELLTISQRNLERAGELFRDNVLSQSDLDATSETVKRQQLAVEQQRLALEESQFDIARLEAQIDRAVAQRDRAALNLERTRITAPFAGIVTRVPVSEGDRVRAGDALVDLYNPGQIEVRAQIPSRYAQAVTAALRADTALPVRLVADGDVLAGRIVRLANATQSGSGGVDAFIAPEGDATRLRLGGTVAVRVRARAGAGRHCRPCRSGLWARPHLPRRR